MQKPI